MNIIKFFTEWYATPYGRLFRRFWIVGLSALIPYFISKVGLDPFTIVDKIIGLGGGEWLLMAKLFIGAGLVAGLDKLVREWKNIVGQN